MHGPVALLVAAAFGMGMQAFCCRPQNLCSLSHWQGFSDRNSVDETDPSRLLNRPSLPCSRSCQHLSSSPCHWEVARAPGRRGSSSGAALGTGWQLPACRGTSTSVLCVGCTLALPQRSSRQPSATSRHGHVFDLLLLLEPAGVAGESPELCLAPPAPR